MTVKVLANALIQAEAQKAKQTGNLEVLVKVLTAWLDKSSGKQTAKPEGPEPDHSDVETAMIRALVEAMKLADTQEKRDELMDKLLAYGEEARASHAKREKQRSLLKWVKVSFEGINVAAGVALLFITVRRSM